MFAQKLVTFLEARAAVGLVFVGGDIAECLAEIFLMDAVAVVAVVAFDNQERACLVFQNGGFRHGEASFLRKARAETFVVHKVGEVGAPRLDNMRAGRVFVRDAEAFAVMAERELAHCPGEGKADMVTGGKQGAFGEIAEDSGKFFGREPDNAVAFGERLLTCREEGHRAGAVAADGVGELDVVVARDVEAVGHDVAGTFFGQNACKEGARLAVGEFLSAKRQGAGERNAFLLDILWRVAEGEAIVVVAVELARKRAVEENVKVYHRSTSRQACRQARRVPA